MDDSLWQQCSSKRPNSPYCGVDYDDAHEIRVACLRKVILLKIRAVSSALNRSETA